APLCGGGRVRLRDHPVSGHRGQGALGLGAAGAGLGPAGAVAAGLAALRAAAEALHAVRAGDERRRGRFGLLLPVCHDQGHAEGEVRDGVAGAPEPLPVLRVAL
ncbi:unnamed protein product, partial [Effrenium voratum]